MSYKIFSLTQKLIIKKDKEAVKKKVIEHAKHYRIHNDIVDKDIEIIGLLVDEGLLAIKGNKSCHKVFEEAKQKAIKKFGKNIIFFGPIVNHNFLPEIIKARFKATKEEIPRLIMDYLIVKIK